MTPFWFGLIVGAVVGAILGYLFAFIMGPMLPSVVHASKALRTEHPGLPEHRSCQYPRHHHD